MAQRAAIRYAKALLSLAEEQKSAEVLNNDMRFITNAVNQSKELSTMLESPVIPASVKKSALLEVFKGGNKLTHNLINTLIANKRIQLLNDIAGTYNQLYAESKGEQTAIVTTAVPLTDELTSKVLSKVKELTGKEASIENIVDEAVLGGFILRVGDIQYDASISNKLNKLKREFTLN